MLCDDGTMPDDFAPKKFMDLCTTALGKFNMNFRGGNVVGEKLEKAGFMNVSCKTIKTPVGRWPKVSSPY
jgi:hypothetical protein